MRMDSINAGYLISALVLVLVGFGLGWLPLRSGLRREMEELKAEHRAALSDYQALREASRADAARLERLPVLEREREQLQVKLEAGAKAASAVSEQLASAQAAAAAAERRVSELQAQRQEQEQRFVKLQEEHHRLLTEYRTQQAEFEGRRTNLEEKIALLQSAEKQLSQQFENLANRIFEEKGNAFKQANQESLDKLLKPFQENLQGLHNDVKEASKERHSLSKEIERIVTEANALTQALKGDSKVQGDWGEVVLARVLESTGLRAGEEYVLQQSFATEDGRARPDAIINLPERRNIVIDSKVSLTAYTRYCNSADEQERAAQLAAHVESVKKHIRDLAERRYDHIEAIQSVDFTLMFVPIEPAYFAALQKEPGLVTFAMEKRVILVCPTTLFATLKTIERIWTYERQNQNTQKIVRQATTLYDKLCGFMESMDKVGRAIGTASKSYEDAYSQLKTGRGNVIAQAAKLKEMGLGTKKSLASDLVEGALEDDVSAVPALADSAEELS
jgi:DNA recombination protein RmuC